MRITILTLFLPSLLVIASCSRPAPPADGEPSPSEVVKESEAPIAIQESSPSVERLPFAQAKIASPLKLEEQPINPAELKSDTEGAAYIFAMRDLGNDRSLVTESATEPYLNQIAMLTRAYGLTGAEIGNAVLSSAEELDRSNSDYKYSDILDAMLTLDVMENAKLSELLATYAVFRSKGESHGDTVRQLHALLTALKDGRAKLQDQIQPAERKGPAG